MKRFGSLFFTVTVILLLAWQIPGWATFLTAEASKIPFTLYSPLLGDFISFERIDEKTILRRDRTGSTYTQEQVDSLLPFFYMRQLVADGRFPDEVCGVKVTPHDVQRTSFTYRISPADLNAPAAGLHPCWRASRAAWTSRCPTMCSASPAAGSSSSAWRATRSTKRRAAASPKR